MPELREVLANYTDEKLLDQYFNHKDEYTSDALDIMREEISKRGITEGQLTTYLHQESVTKAQVQTLDSKDFVPFDHAFSQVDMLLAHAILRENNVPFYVDNPVSNTLPLENEAVRLFTIHVHKDHAENAHALLDEHFTKSDGRYQLKYSGARERLLLFSFHDVHLSELEAAEELEVSFTDEERRAVEQFGRRLLDEVDAVETEQQRVVFYYDNVEPLIERLNDPKRASYSRTDLLTVLEILQIYCNDPEFPPGMDEAIGTLLSVFIG